MELLSDKGWLILSVLSSTRGKLILSVLLSDSGTLMLSGLLPEAPVWYCEECVHQLSPRRHAAVALSTCGDTAQMPESTDAS